MAEKRFADGGVEGLAERSGQPRSCPTATCLDLEERIVGLRKELADEGKDHGTDPILWAAMTHIRRCRKSDVPTTYDVAVNT